MAESVLDLLVLHERREDVLVVEVDEELLFALVQSLHEYNIVIRCAYYCVKVGEVRVVSGEERD